MLGIGLILSCSSPEGSDAGSQSDDLAAVRDRGDTFQPDGAAADVRPEDVELDRDSATHDTEDAAVGDLAPDASCEPGPACTDTGAQRLCIEGEIEVVECPPGTLCDEESGACIDGPECAADERRCSHHNTYVACVDGEFGDPIDCEEGTQCLEGECLNACEMVASSADYTGCSFWAVDLDNVVDAEGEGPGASPSAVVLSNPGGVEAQVTITRASGEVLDDTTLDVGETQAFPLPRADLVGTRVAASAFHVETDQPVLAYQFSPLQREGTSSVDATLLIPTPALDDTYRALTWPGQGYNQRGTLTVIAVADSPTTVSLQPNGAVASGVDFLGLMSLPAERTVSPQVDETLSVVLERGQVLHVQSEDTSDLSGSLIVADASVAVFAGTRCTNVPSEVPKCDHLEHQMLPLRNWGRTYVAPGGAPRGTESTWYRAVAAFDDTSVTTSADSGGPTVLHAGDVMTFEVDEPLVVTASAPIMLGMFLASAEAADGQGDPSFTLIPPSEQFRESYVFLTPNEFERDTLTIIRRLGDEVVLDEEPVDTSWHALVGDQWEVGHVEVIDGPHTVTGARGFGIIATGYDEEVSYAFAGGLYLEKFAEAEPPAFSGHCDDGTAIGSPCATGSHGICGPGRVVCDDGTPSCAPLAAETDEVCNGRDDNCDGTVDSGDCDGFALERQAPTSDRVRGKEGQALTFTVSAVGEASGLTVTWSVDGDVVTDQTGTTLVWTPLAFDDGPRVVVAQVASGERIAEVDWLVLVTDAPSNRAAIWGRVTMPDGSVPPSLTLETSDGPSDESAVIDGRGYYAITLDPGVYDVSVDTVFEPAPGWFPRGVVTLANDLAVNWQNVRHDIALPVARVSGTVTNAGGEPLPDTEVEFSGDCFACSGSTTAGDDGTYELWIFRGTQEVSATPPPSARLPTRIESGVEVVGDRVYNIVFDPVWDITGVVVDQYEEPVPGVTLEFEGPRAEVAFETEAGGRFSVRLPADDYRVALDTVFNSKPANIGRGVVTLIEALEVSATTPEQLIPLPNAWVTGTVVGEGTSTPIPDVVLDFTGDCFACSGSTTTDADGEYGLPLLNSRYKVEITPPEISRYANMDISDNEVSGDRTLDIELLGPVYVLSGVVVDPRGAPIAGIALETVGRTETAASTGIDGSFSLRVLGGSYDVDVDTVFNDSPDGFPRGVVEVWTGDVNADRSVTITAPLSYVTGRVQERAGDVIPGAELDFTGSCFACSQTAVTNGSGEYDVTVFASTYQVEVTPPAPRPKVTLEGVDCTAVDVTVNVDY